MSFTPCEILLVEDNPAEVNLTIEALKEGKILSKLNVVSDGEQAIDYLKQKGRYTGATRPHLVLLDLNLPKKNGREVLADIKSDPILKKIPIVVLTASDNEDDIVRAYNLHANCYVKKPIDFDQFTKVIKDIEEFWFTIVLLPQS